MSRELVQVLDNAEAQAKALQDDFTSTEHFLLALAKDSKSDAGKALAQVGVTSEVSSKPSLLFAARIALLIKIPRPNTRPSKNTART